MWANSYWHDTYWAPNYWDKGARIAAIAHDVDVDFAARYGNAADGASRYLIDAEAD